MRITYFDLGAHIGNVAKSMIEMLKETNIPWKAFLFEPAEESYSVLLKRFKNHPNISVHKIAFTNIEGLYPLYHALISTGHSLHINKRNVRPNDYEIVECKIFSKWIKDNIGEKTEKDFYIVRANIEGSEFEFYSDLIESGLYKSIDIYSGTISDIYKLTGLSEEYINNFKKLICRKGINIIKVNENHKENIPEIKRMILSWKKTNHYLEDIELC